MIERLDLADSDHSALRAWKGSDVAGSADLVRGEVLGDGVCLAPVATRGAVVVPVVKWNAAVLSRRSESGMGAVLDVVTLRDRLEEGVDTEATPLQVVGWVVVSPIVASWDAMARLSPFGPVVCCAPGRPRSWTLMECDVLGYSVASVRDGAVQALVHGHAGPRPGTCPLSLSVRSWQEQLFDVSLRCGGHAQYGRSGRGTAGP